MRRNVIVIHSLKLAYFRIPKAANTSIKTKLASILYLESEKFTPTQDNFWRFNGSKNVDFISNKEYYDKYSHYFGFTFFRDPIDRLLSLYNSNIAKWEIRGAFKELGFSGDMSADEFVYLVLEIDKEDADIHFYPQTEILSYQGKFLPNFMGNFSKIEQDWLRLRDILNPLAGIEIGLIPHLNKTSDKNRMRNLSDENIAQLEKKYAGDFAISKQFKSIDS